MPAACHVSGRGPGHPRVEQPGPAGAAVPAAAGGQRAAAQPGGGGAAAGRCGGQVTRIRENAGKEGSREVQEGYSSEGNATRQ